MTKTCCKTSVGVLIFSADRTELLMIERGTLPAGIAPVAGHGDLTTEHPTFEAAARAEVREEVGLEVTGLTRLPVGGYHPGRCRRPGSTGHKWEVFEATVTGELAASEREVRRAGWWSLGDLQHLAERTADHAAGLITADDFALTPGLEPVWCHWLHELGYIDLPAVDLDAIEALAATPQGDR
uniref:PSQ10.17c n=1 Tax=Nocardiopsis sp. 90127 TaxID=373213 RepID=Q27I71_9ACTN|nr:NUDIX hydrolase [Nocardiopsis sp. 90127]ABD48740.1 pSQ10.17c [Nocardiopsis sp. 90127]